MTPLDTIKVARKTMIAEIIGPSGKVHYRRPDNDPMVDEARNTAGYSVRFVPLCPKDDSLCYLPECAEHGCMDPVDE